MAAADRLLPLAGTTTSLRARIARALFGVLAIAAAACAICFVAGASDLQSLFGMVVTVSGAALVTLRACWVREGRAPWVASAAALALLTAGQIYYAVAFAGEAVWPAP